MDTPDIPDDILKASSRFFGSLGGQKTAKKYGKSHYQRIALLAVDKRKENNRLRHLSAVQPDLTQ